MFGLLSCCLLVKSLSLSKCSIYFVEFMTEMSKQRGKGFHGGRRKHAHKDNCDLKWQNIAEQRKMKFDEDKFLRDMECALGCIFHLFKFILHYTAYFVSPELNCQ